MFDQLKIALRSATETHFRALQARPEIDGLYGYSLYTDDDVCSIGPVANTVDKIPVPAGDATYGYYRYGPQEWSLFDDFGMFESVNQIVSDIHASENLSFDLKRDGMLQVAFQVLVELEEEGFFGSKESSRYVVLWLSDSSDPIMNASAKALNSQAVFAAYCKEYS